MFNLVSDTVRIFLILVNMHNALHHQYHVISHQHCSLYCLWMQLIIWVTYWWMQVNSGVFRHKRNYFNGFLTTNPMQWFSLVEFTIYFSSVWNCYILTKIIYTSAATIHIAFVESILGHVFTTFFSFIFFLISFDSSSYFCIQNHGVEV